MSADTRDKQFSMIGWRTPTRIIAPTPDGAFSEVGDWQQLLGLYRGIELADLVVVAVGGEWRGRTVGVMLRDRTVQPVLRDRTVRPELRGRT